MTRAPSGTHGKQALSALLVFVMDSAPASELSRLLGHLVGRTPPGSFGTMTERAMLLMCAIMSPLVYLRDAGKLRFTVH